MSRLRRRRRIRAPATTVRRRIRARARCSASAATSLIGQVIIGTGDFANGMMQAGNGIDKAGYTWPAARRRPAVRRRLRRDAATRSSSSAARSGSTSIGRTATPCSARSPTRPTRPASPSSGAGSPTSRTASSRSVRCRRSSSTSTTRRFRRTSQWNVGLQFALPWASSIDVSYVGHHAFDVARQHAEPGRREPEHDRRRHDADGSGTGSDAGAGTALNNNLLRAVPRLRQHQRADAGLAPDVPLAAAPVATAVPQRLLASRSTTPGRSTTRATQALPGPQLRLIHDAGRHRTRSARIRRLPKSSSAIRARRRTSSWSTARGTCPTCRSPTR